MKRPAYGFTLLELMVAVTVTLVLLALVLPGFREVLSRNQLGSETTVVMATIQLGRSEAIKQNQTLQLCHANADLTACSGQAGQWQSFLLADLANPPLILRAGHFGQDSQVFFDHAELRVTAQGFFRTADNEPLNSQFEFCPPQNGPGRVLRLWSAGRMDIQPANCGGS